VGGHHSQRTHLRVAVLIALAAAAGILVPGAAQAQGFFDFLFGGSQQRPAPQQPDAYPPPPPEIGRIAPAPLGPESVTEGGGSTGHTVAFCVRLCDGEHFPMEQMRNGTPVEACRAICPYSKTKVFFGSEIGGAVAQDGQTYASLDTAFLYRKQLIANCTCNGKNSLGLLPLDVKNDPTLRPGDIVSTKDGLLSYTGKADQAGGFTPVDPATLPVDIRPGTAQLRLPPSTTPSADDEPGTIVPTDKRANAPAPASPPQNRTPR
jgi:hypothetical protein